MSKQSITVAPRSPQKMYLVGLEAQSREVHPRYMMGALHDVMETSNPAVIEVFIFPMIRGHLNCPDLSTAISHDPSFDSVESNHGIPVKSNKQRKNIRSYLETYVARFCLSLTKYNGNQHRGELMTVPLVDFDRTWDDESLCELFGITKKEYKEILRVIPEFY